jgi:acetyl esterase/lipase
MHIRFLLIAFLGLVFSATAQKEVALYDGPVANSKPCTVKENMPAEGRIASITTPVLYVYQPARKDSMKTAVIICPGGGYARLAINHEGFQVAEALNKRGITAFVLKYRNPIDSTCFINKETVALEDAQMALVQVRKKCLAFGINPNMVGMMGFSAGGHLTSTVATHFNTTTLALEQGTLANLRPDFIVLGYPVISFQDSIMHRGSKENMLGKDATKSKVDLYSNELHVTPQTPPAFLLHAADDKAVKIENSLLFYAALLRNKVPAEMHVLQAGGHGFGLNNKAEPFNWLNLVFTWMQYNKFMKGDVE